MDYIRMVLDNLYIKTKVVKILTSVVIMNIPGT